MDASTLCMRSLPCHPPTWLADGHSGHRHRSFDGCSVVAKQIDDVTESIFVLSGSYITRDSIDDVVVGVIDA